MLTSFDDALYMCKTVRHVYVGQGNSPTPGPQGDPPRGPRRTLPPKTVTGWEASHKTTMRRGAKQKRLLGGVPNKPESHKPRTVSVSQLCLQGPFTARAPGRRQAAAPTAWVRVAPPPPGDAGCPGLNVCPPPPIHKS